MHLNANWLIEWSNSRNIKRKNGNFQLSASAGWKKTIVLRDAQTALSSAIWVSTRTTLTSTNNPIYNWASLSLRGQASRKISFELRVESAWPPTNPANSSINQNKAPLVCVRLFLRLLIWMRKTICTREATPPESRSASAHLWFMHLG